MSETQATGRTRPIWPLLLYLSVTLLYLLVFDYRVRIPFDAIHLIERDLLATDLLSTLWHYHAQPPLPNLVLGLSIQLADLTGISVQTVLLPILLSLGLVTVLSLQSLAFALLPRALATVVCALWLLYPPFYEYLFLYYFVAFEMACLVALPALALRYARDPTRCRFVAFAAILIVLTCARSLFHPLFAVLVLCGMVACRRCLTTAPDRGRFLLTLVALLVLSLWPIKNLALFGFFGYSSWQGAQLVRNLPVPEHPLRPLFYRPHIEPFEGPLLAARTEAATLVPAAFADVPVLARLSKPSGSPNWNHHAMIRYGAEQQQAALAAMVANPEALLHKIKAHYLDGFVHYPLRHPTAGVLQHASENPWLVRWSSLIDTVVFQGWFMLFAIMFPLLFFWSAFHVWRALRAGRKDALPLTIAFGTVSFVTLMVLLVDGEEGNRMRLPIDPLLLLLAAYAVRGEKGRR